MASIVRVTTRWSGFPGSPGYTNLYAEVDTTAGERAQDLSDSWRAFLATVNGFLPSDAHLLILPTYAVINDATGLITAEGTISSAAAVVDGNNGGAYAGNVGYCLEWGTADFIDGRRLKGRTFMVPAVGCFDTDGTIESSAVQNLAGAATSFIAGAMINVVWHRPVNGAGGSSSEINSVVVRDRAAILRSRSI